MPDSRLRAQMSPGPLSTAHRSIDGPLDCAQCHAFGAGRVEFKCLDCHDELRRRVAANRGYHARIKGGTNSNECARCHSEHNGRAYPLIRWRPPKEKFDHRETGWPLEAKHAGLRCEECHQPKNMVPEERAALKRTDLAKSLLGLSPSCATCHNDPHKGELGSSCTRCHTLETWKGAPGFNHQNTEYPLTGKHSSLACAKCHVRQTAEGPRTLYRNFVFQEFCKSCHKDVHGGAFPDDCKKCHTPEGWLPPKQISGFDHSKAEYPLEGKHAVVACRKCHQTENFGAKVAHGKCLDCHKDYHENQFLTRNDKGDCASCHAVAGFRPARFGVTEHAATKYPLAGKHAKVECAQCHKPAKGATPYHPAFGACLDCHLDRHSRQFASAPRDNRCDQCHDVQGFRPARFTLSDHCKTRFVLAGAHAAVACGDCHRSSDGRPESTRYHFAAIDCASCHRDPHKTAAAAARALPSCDGCHTLRAWKETGPFDHAATKFPLLGRHRTTACVACHKPSGEAAAKVVPFTGTSVQCGSCHKDAHDGQFLVDGTAACGRCHTALNWRPTEFDHARHSAFSLKGAHERVPCRLCHEKQPDATGRMVIRYKGIPAKCEECHT